MDDAGQALWEALGCPRLADHLPLASEPAWAVARRSLTRALNKRGYHDRIRSPRALWTLLHPTQQPHGATWRDLLAGSSLDTLARALADRVATTGVKLVSWNARWLVSPHAEQATRNNNSPVANLRPRCAPSGNALAR